ncbi:MAG: phage tail protein [Wolbachia sp.]
MLKGKNRNNDNKGIKQNSTVAEVRRNQKSERKKENTKKGIKNKFIILKANKKRLWSRVRLILDLVWVAKLGSIKQTKRGAKVGSTLYEGAFIAVMKNGHVGIFRRRCMKSVPIDEEKVKSHADEIIKALAENKVEEMFEKYFYQQMSYIK